MRLTEKIGEVSPLSKRRASPVLIDEDFAGCTVHSSHVEDYYRAPRWRLTTRYHGYIIIYKNDEGQNYLIAN
jgi:hypothetical protein